MAKFTLPLLPYETRTADETGDAFPIPPNVKRMTLTLNVGAGITGTSPTLGVKVQGSPLNENTNWYTALPCYRTGTAPNPIAGRVAWASLNTAQLDVKFSEHPMPYVRAIVDVGGSSPSFPCGLVATCYED